MRPKDEWIVTSHPELRIVPQDLWDNAKDRQRKQAANIGSRMRRGLLGHRARVTGAYPKYVFSGVLPNPSTGFGGTIAKSSGGFFFIWTLIALGVIALFSVILSARGLWEHLPRPTDTQHK
jgi:hypothetical protein